MLLRTACGLTLFVREEPVNTFAHVTKMIDAAVQNQHIVEDAQLERQIEKLIIVWAKKVEKLIFTPSTDTCRRGSCKRFFLFSQPLKKKTRTPRSYIFGSWQLVASEW